MFASQGVALGWNIPARWASRGRRGFGWLCDSAGTCIAPSHPPLARVVGNVGGHCTQLIKRAAFVVIAQGDGGTAPELYGIPGSVLSDGLTPLALRNRFQRHNVLERVNPRGPRQAFFNPIRPDLRPREQVEN